MKIDEEVAVRSVLVLADARLDYGRVLHPRKALRQELAHLAEVFRSYDAARRVRIMRGAVAARAADRALRGDGYRTLAAGNSAVAFERSSGADRSVVAANAGEDAAELVLPGPLDVARLASLLSTDERAATMRATDDGGVAIALPGRWAGIWRVGR